MIGDEQEKGKVKSPAIQHRGQGAQNRRPFKIGDGYTSGPPSQEWLCHKRARCRSSRSLKHVIIFGLTDEVKAVLHVQELLGSAAGKS